MVDSPARSAASVDWATAIVRLMVDNLPIAPLRLASALALRRMMVGWPSPRLES
jgi:hypothetical protein